MGGGTGGTVPVTSGTENLIWNPNNPIGTETLSKAAGTTNEGWLQNLLNSPTASKDLKDLAGAFKDAGAEAGKGTGQAMQPPGGGGAGVGGGRGSGDLAALLQILAARANAYYDAARSGTVPIGAIRGSQGRGLLG